MEIGFVSKYSEERVAFAGAHGFDTLEIPVNPGGDLDWATMSADDAKRVREVFEEREVRVASVFVNVPHLDPDAPKRKAHAKYFTTALKRARELGTNIVTTLGVGNPAQSPEDNLPVFQDLFTEHAKVAEGEGVVIGFENWPNAGGYPVTVGNIAYTPALWEKMFDAVPSPAIGLEFDPSHLRWLGIPAAPAIRQFADRIHFFHAKDTEILSDRLESGGIFSHGWWRYRVPGWGELDWQEIFCVLAEIGYDRGMVIEQEDPVFSGERFDEGLLLGLKYLDHFVVR